MHTKLTHLHQCIDGESDVETKKAFKTYDRKHNVEIKHYHVENMRFADNDFIDCIESRNQNISYCASYAHHQNGRAGKSIRDMTEKARVSLLHSIQK